MVGRTCGGGSAEELGWGAPREAVGALSLSPTPCPLPLLHLAVLSRTLGSKGVTRVNKCSPEFCELLWELA